MSVLVKGNIYQNEVYVKLKHEIYSRSLWKYPKSTNYKSSSFYSSNIFDMTSTIHVMPPTDGFFFMSLYLFPRHDAVTHREKSRNSFIYLKVR